MHCVVMCRLTDRRLFAPFPMVLFCYFQLYSRVRRRTCCRDPDCLEATPYHPVHVKGQWQFPVDVAPALTRPDYTAVYSLLLKFIIRSISYYSHTSFNASFLLGWHCTF